MIPRLTTRNNDERITLLQIRKIHINNSENPFAYIRTDTDIDILLTNLLQTYPDEAEVPKACIQLLFILFQFTVYALPVNEKTFNIVYRMLDLFTAGDNRRPSYLFQTMIYDLDLHFNRFDLTTLKFNYDLFRSNWYDNESFNFPHVATICRSILDHKNTKTCLQNLRCKEVIRQAKIITTQGSRFDLWFSPSDQPDLNINCLLKSKLVNGGDYFQAEVSVGHAFSQHLYGKNRLNKQFIVSILQLCTKAYSNSARKISPAVKNKFLNEHISSSDNVKFVSLAYDDQRLAVHEAAHVVCHWLFNMRIASVEINKDGGVVHEDFAETPALHTNFKEVYRQLLLHYAGYTAEAEVYGNLIDYDPVPHDIKLATCWAKNYVMVHSPSFDPFLLDYDRLGVPQSFWISHETIVLCQKARTKTKQVIRQNLDLIHALANNLCQSKSLSGSDVDKILSSFDISRKGSLQKELDEAGKYFLDL